MNIIGFLRKPDERLLKDNRVPQLLRTLFYFSITFFLSVAFAVLFLRLGWNLPTKTTSDDSVAMTFLAVFLFPLFEETIFRLPLKRSKCTVSLSLFVFSFCLLSKAFGVFYFSTDHLIIRLALTITATAILYGFIRKFVYRINYPVFFYSMALGFGLIHLFNVDCDGLVFSVPLAIALSWYILDKAIGGVLYGYARLKHGFVAAVALHMLNNSPALLLLLFK